MTEEISVRDIEDRTRLVHHSALLYDFETEEDGKRYCQRQRHNGTGKNRY